MVAPGSPRTSGSVARTGGRLRATLAVGLLVLGAGDLTAIHTVLLPDYLASLKKPPEVALAAVESPTVKPKTATDSPSLDGSIDSSTDCEESLEAAAPVVAQTPPTPGTKTGPAPAAVAVEETVDSSEWPHLLFERSTSRLSEESLATLGKLAEQLKQHADLGVVLAGHTDDIGAPEINRALSLIRAGRAKHWLVAQGVKPGQVEVHSFGASRPALRDRSAEARARNRRVEITVRERVH
jgi:outer membrane protein OmpA-like peptidoglycan-associated protein